MAAWAQRASPQQVLIGAAATIQARKSNGGFFQDNRQLDIVEVYPDRYGPSMWVEE